MHFIAAKLMACCLARHDGLIAGVTLPPPRICARFCEHARIRLGRITRDPSLSFSIVTRNLSVCVFNVPERRSLSD